jgi:hypothetical protein
MVLRVRKASATWLILFYGAKSKARVLTLMEFLRYVSLKPQFLLDSR